MFTKNLRNSRIDFTVENELIDQCEIFFQNKILFTTAYFIKLFIKILLSNNQVHSTFSCTKLIHSANPQSGQVVIIIIAHVVRLFVSSFVPTTCETVGLAQWIIDDTCLVSNYFLQNEVQAYVCRRGVREGYPPPPDEKFYWPSPLENLGPYVEIKKQLVLPPWPIRPCTCMSTSQL